MFRKYLQDKNLIHPRFRCVLKQYTLDFNDERTDPSNPLCIEIIIDGEGYDTQVSCSSKEHLNHLLLYLDVILYDSWRETDVNPQVSHVVFNNKIYDVNSLEILLQDILNSTYYPLTVEIYELEGHELIEVGGNMDPSYVYFTYGKGRYTWDIRDDVSIFRK